MKSEREAEDRDTACDLGEDGGREQVDCFERGGEEYGDVRVEDVGDCGLVAC